MPSIAGHGKESFGCTELSSKPMGYIDFGIGWNLQVKSKKLPSGTTTVSQAVLITSPKSVWHRKYLKTKAK